MEVSHKKGDLSKVKALFLWNRCEAAAATAPEEQVEPVLVNRKGETPFPRLLVKKFWGRV
jgi:hypothetical protein